MNGDVTCATARFSGRIVDIFNDIQVHIRWMNWKHHQLYPIVRSYLHILIIGIVMFWTQSTMIVARPQSHRLMRISTLTKRYQELQRLTLRTISIVRQWYISIRFWDPSIGLPCQKIWNPPDCHMTDWSILITLDTIGKIPITILSVYRFRLVTYIYIHVYIYTCVYIYIYKHTYTHMYTHVYISFQLFGVCNYGHRSTGRGAHFLSPQRGRCARRWRRPSFNRYF